MPLIGNSKTRQLKGYMNNKKDITKEHLKQKLETLMGFCQSTHELYYNLEHEGWIPYPLDTGNDGFQHIEKGHLVTFSSLGINRDEIDALDKMNDRMEELEMSDRDRDTGYEIITDESLGIPDEERTDREQEISERDTENEFDRDI